ncbi:MAG: glycosyltransferase [Chitinophagaceae bacterium]
MSFGLPCISFDCPTGPADIISHGINGLLVEKENPGKLAQAVSSLINDGERRRSMGQKAFENIKNFSPENIYELWSSSFQ